MERELIIFFIFLLGLCFGSFANVCIHRLPLDQSILRPRSKCPHCGMALLWRHNIPLLSFILLGGKCAGCRRPISWRYPMVEAGFAVILTATCFQFLGHPFMGAIGGVFVFFLWVIAFIDAEHRIIPDVLSLPLIFLGIISSPVNSLLGAAMGERVFESLLGTVAGFFLLWSVALIGKLVWRKDAMGGGDIKLMCAIGAFLGWKGTLHTLFAASLIGTLWALFEISRRRAGRGSYVPFGPFLALGAWGEWLRIHI